MSGAPQKSPSLAPARPAVGLRYGLFAVFTSLALHLALAVVLVSRLAAPLKQVSETVRVKINEVEKPKPLPAPEKPAEKPPQEPKPLEKPKPKRDKPKRSSERKPASKPPEKAKPTPPVQGLSASAVSPNGTGIAAPIGNTLMAPDEGKRLKPSEVKPLSDEDLSADAVLVRSSVPTPQYTEAALDAELEGTYKVDVFVDATGVVTDAQLPKKIGYAMDERVLSAARQARFRPRQDRYGKPLAGWTEMVFRLEIPH